MEIYKHICIIGRIAGDDEDELVKTYENCSLSEACEAFEKEVSEEWPEETRHAAERYGEAMYILHILTSESPIIYM